MRLRLALLAVLLPLVLWGLAPVLADGQSLSGKIDRKQGEVDAKRAERDRLSGQISSYTGRINSLQGDISSLEGKRVSLQTDLDAKLARLSAIQSELRSERARLTRLRARLAEGRVVLSNRLVDLYKADDPDILNVVLESDGFADLLERSEFARRVGKQDRRIIVAVREAKVDAVATEKKLAKLEAEAKEIAAAVEKRRDAVVEVQDGLRSRQDMFARVRGQRRVVLSKVKSSLSHAEEDLAALEREQAKVQARLAGVSPGGPVKQGSGDLNWPVNGQFTSPFGYRWGRLHAGIDIAVPVGTAVHAAAAGRVQIAGWTGGYGNYICIQHEGSLSTCYGHNSRLAVSVGQQVSQGQVIAASGNTGNSTGPHVHFETRVNGVPQDPMGYL